MRNLRGLTVEEVGVLDIERNIFFGRSGEFIFKVMQPRKKHASEHRRVWKKLKPYTKELYRRLYEDPIIYDSKWRCRLPLYRGDVPGFIPLIMVVDKKIVGVSDIMFKYGSEFKLYDIPEKDVGCNMNLCVLDSLQGMGVGSFYSNISTFIAKHFKSDWVLGSTKFKKGMYHIRMKQGWDLHSRNREYARIRKKL